MPYRPIAARWLVLAAVLLALCWLLPNHALPWLSFQSDAWAAFVLLLIACWLLPQAGRLNPWSRQSLAVLTLALLPAVQWAAGQIPYFGAAWVQVLYLAGLALAWRLGEVWEGVHPSQALDFLFLACSLAALVSVGLQLQQWFGLAGGTWVLQVDYGQRLYANMAQPNHLASLDLLGLLGVAWAYARKRLGAGVALCAAVWLLLGLVLTESRTAYLNVLLLFAACVLRRKLLPQGRFLWACSALILGFAAAVAVLPQAKLWVARVAAPEQWKEAPDYAYRGMSDPARIKAWTVFLDASTRRPWLGYGWGRTPAAELAVVAEHPGATGYFTSAHNLVLDLVLWNGYPLGLLIAGALFWWWWQRWRALQSFAHWLLLASLSVLLSHAMLEYPLQYAIFLLPFGLLAGTLHASQESPPQKRRLPGLDLLLLLGCALALVVTVRDYLEVERSFYGLRFESAHIRTNQARTPPQVLVLDYLADYIDFARTPPQSGLQSQQFDAMQDLVSTLPSAKVILLLAQNYARNGQFANAQHWLLVLRKSMDPTVTARMRADWAEDPLYRAVDWPDAP